MNKAELVSAVAEKAQLTEEDAKKAVNAFFAVVQEALKAGDTVQLLGFGTFKVRERTAREGRNPQTGETIIIKASKTPTFKAGKSLRDAMEA
ncbi:DNA-binding protein hu [Heliomicrobium modesticaldum Ice1]|uniref:DNA-binding protein hu n=1 Tax=Heliobacterium modesticaldum (strain ATCC 51547 / Ice1) TaxID=498761 RepID=B0TBB2_HELMI|nr:HU family DNA-binding protein [Heliomicrobium modesticaldum]ABZ83839.1 DNA-binding protein hu [Heliomicrobium modesticaldum Ice1]